MITIQTVPINKLSVQALSLKILSFLKYNQAWCFVLSLNSLKEETQNAESSSSVVLIKFP